MVTLTLLVGNRPVQLTPREYDIQWQLRPQKVIMWPNFISNDWTRYYLYSQKTDEAQPNFLPFFKDRNTGEIIKDRFGRFLTPDNLADADDTTIHVKPLVKTPAGAGNTLPDYEIQLFDTPIWE